MYAPRGVMVTFPACSAQAKLLLVLHIQMPCTVCGTGMIARNLDLNRPRYKKTAAYGHFGREPTSDFTWEKIIDLKAKV